MNSTKVLALAVSTAAVASAAQLRQAQAEFEQMLAQVGQDRSIRHSCTFTPERNKAPLPDIDSIIGSGTPYIDESFPFSDALYWPEAGEYNNGFERIYTQNSMWKSLGEAYPDATLWGDHYVTPEDVNQGGIGNCWFMAAASALAEKPGRIESLIQ